MNTQDTKLVPISVAIPCYNAEPFVLQTLESIAAQTYPIREIVVMDDGSTDASVAIVEKFAQAHAPGWVRLIRADHRGIGITRTEVIRAAQYNDVITIDADDYLVPQAVEWWITYAQEHPEYALIYGDYVKISREGEILGEVRTTERRMDPLEGIIISTLLWENVTGGSNYLQRDKVLEVGGYLMDPAVFATDRLQDVMLHFRLLLAGYPMGYIPRPMYYYRNTPGSLSKRQQEIEVAWKQVFTELFRTAPDKMAEAYLEVRAVRAYQLKDAFEVCLKREAQINAMSAEMDKAREYQTRLEQTLAEAQAYQSKLEALLAESGAYQQKLEAFIAERDQQIAAQSAALEEARQYQQRLEQQLNGKPFPGG